MSAERLLILQMAKLGDFIQSTPLLANLRQKFPGAEIVLACEQMSVLEAASLSPVVDEARLIKENSPLPPGPFSAIFTLNSHPRALELAEKIEAPARYGPTLHRREPRFTTAQNFIINLMRSGNRDLGRFNLADVWASLCPNAGPEALVWPPPQSAVNNIHGLKIAFQLGSKNHLRRWPVENFALAAKELGAEGLITPILLGSEAERAMGARFEKLWGGPVHNLMGRTTLEELAAVLAGLDLLISGDTGTAHLAAAVGTPVLALFFGPAYGPETGPYSPGNLIYQVSAACAPCRENADCRRRQCLALPQVEIAAQAARLLLGRAADLPPLPEGHRIWRTALDSFGQSLEALGYPELTGREALALIITEAARPIIRAGEAAQQARLMAALAGFTVAGGITLEAAILRGLAAAPLGPEYNGAAFLADAERLAANLGFKIA